MTSAKKAQSCLVALLSPSRSSFALAIFCGLAMGLFSSNAWAQRSRTQLNPPPSRPELSRPEPAVTSPVSPIIFPATDVSSAVGKALASCAPKADAVELSLPTVRGEIKLDRCYRGRDHLVCQLNALTAEAKSLLENYRKIVDTNYPAMRDMNDICATNSSALDTDLQNAVEFETRLKAFKAEYEARSTCARRIHQSLTQVAFPEMTQGPSLVKSMTDTIDGDLQGVSEVQSKLVELADKLVYSHKAMITLQKIHRAMCTAHPTATTGGTTPASQQ